MKTLPKHEVGEVVIINDIYRDEVRAIIIEEVIITKKDIKYRGNLSFRGEDKSIIFYDKDEFDYSGGFEPSYTIVQKVGNYNAD